ncbi:MAG: class I SAM-dependent methyltransferase [Pseudomonadota bacterium]|nr:class I SAM-dependent methyltransferase [Pseudomonadota bacterium]
MKKILNQVIEKTLFKVLDSYVERNLIPRLTHHFYDNIDFHQRQGAMESSARFAAEHLQGVRPFADKFEGLKYAIERAEKPGLFLEFGVASGRSINFIAANTEAVVYGFDSFQGLPEDWRPGVGKGAFRKPAEWRPEVRANVELNVGWFEDTLPDFLADHHGDIAFLHVDCDLYSSTTTVLSLLADRLKPGSVIVFDEYFSYIGWEKHEHAAFREFIEKHQKNFDYILYQVAGSPAQVAAILT